MNRNAPKSTTLISKNAVVLTFCVVVNFTAMAMALESLQINGDMKKAQEKSEAAALGQQLRGTVESVGLYVDSRSPSFNRLNPISESKEESAARTEVSHSNTQRSPGQKKAPQQNKL